MTEANNSVSPQPEVAENKDYCPSTSTGRASSLLHSLLGQTFSDASVTPLHHQSVHVIADEEMTRYRSTPPPSLSEDPFNRWYVNEVSFPLLSKMAKRYLCIPATSVSAERECFPLREILLQPSKAHLLLNTWTNCCSFTKT